MQRKTLFLVNKNRELAICQMIIITQHNFYSVTHKMLMIDNIRAVDKYQRKQKTKTNHAPTELNCIEKTKNR